MNKTLLPVLMLAFLSGCATARLPQGPDVFSLQSYPDRATVVVPKAVDLRGTMKAGTIGAATVKVKEDLADLTTNYIIDALNTRMNLNVVTSEALSDSNAANVIASKNADGALVVEITQLKMHSIDALMQPVQVDMAITAHVYDSLGNRMSSSDIVGHYEKRIGLSIVDKSTGELVDRTVQDISHNLSKNNEVLTAFGQTS